ncbi:transposase [Rhizobium gallicum]|uniref:transposase n=1 Tax=Rhizobium gallicum TaxID=56730 RepID=UPI00193ABECC
MLHDHLFFVTKYRRDVLSEPAIGDLRRIFAKLCRDVEAELIACDGEDDHLHLWCIPCDDRLSKLVNSRQGVTSRLLRDSRRENHRGTTARTFKSNPSGKWQKAALAFLPGLNAGALEVHDEGSPCFPLAKVCVSTTTRNR